MPVEGKGKPQEIVVALRELRADLEGVEAGDVPPAVELRDAAAA